MEKNAHTGCVRHKAVLGGSIQRHFPGFAPVDVLFPLLWGQPCGSCFTDGVHLNSIFGVPGECGVFCRGHDQPLNSHSNN